MELPIALAENGETAAWSAAKEVEAMRPPKGEEPSGSTVTWTSFLPEVSAVKLADFIGFTASRSSGMAETQSAATAPFVPEQEDGEASAAASAPPAVSYYYSDAAKGALGPCQLTQLRVLWVSGHIGRDTSVWREGLGSWLPVHALPEVADALLPLAQPPSASAAAAAPWYHLDASGQRSARLTAGLTSWSKKVSPRLSFFSTTGIM